MFKNVIAIAALALLAASASAATPNTFYAGLDGGATKIHGLGDQQGSYGAFVGYNFHQYFAVEAGARRLGSWDLEGVDLDVNQYAVSIIGMLPVASDVDVYARLGSNRIKLRGSSHGFTKDDTDQGGLFGVGLAYHFAPAIVGRVEFQKPASDSHTLIAAVAFKF